MKVAVLFSGQIRGESYKDNIWWWKTHLPEADMFFTSWDDNDFDWIDHKFEEPHIPYNSERYIHKLWLKKLREIKKEHGFVPPAKTGAEPHRVLSYQIRKTGRDRVKQHLAHALAFEKYCEDKDYDVVFRVRYDLKYTEDFTREVLHYMINLSYHQKTPVSIGYMGEYEGTKFNYIPHIEAFGDVVICHRADMFKPQIVYDLVASKKLKSAEGGWWQILCEPFHVNVYCASCAYVKIERERWR